MIFYREDPMTRVQGLKKRFSNNWTKALQLESIRLKRFIPNAQFYLADSSNLVSNIHLLVYHIAEIINDQHLEFQVSTKKMKSGDVRDNCIVIGFHIYAFIQLCPNVSFLQSSDEFKMGYLQPHPYIKFFINANYEISKFNDLRYISNLNHLTCNDKESAEEICKFLTSFFHSLKKYILSKEGIKEKDRFRTPVIKKIQGLMRYIDSLDKLHPIYNAYIFTLSMNSSIIDPIENRRIYDLDKIKTSFFRFCENLFNKTRHQTDLSSFCLGYVWCLNYNLKNGWRYEVVLFVKNTRDLIIDSIKDQLVRNWNLSSDNLGSLYYYHDRSQSNNILSYIVVNNGQKLNDCLVINQKWTKNEALTQFLASMCVPEFYIQQKKYLDVHMDQLRSFPGPIHIIGLNNKPVNGSYRIPFNTFGRSGRIRS